jgi:hypothetical protein
MRPLPTSPDHRLFAGGGLSSPAANGAEHGIAHVEERPITRRFYWELAGARRRGGPAATEMLADPRLDLALSLLRAARPDDPLRIACVIELGERTSVEPILRARAALARHEIALDLWPQLSSDDAARRGARFLNTSTAATFQARLLPLLDELEKSAEGSDIGLSLDVEPTEDLIRAAWLVRDGDASLLERARGIAGVCKGIGRALLDARQGRRDLTELARDLAARDLPVHAAVLPPLGRATPGPHADGWRTWALGCPVVDVEGGPLFGLQAAMCYAPLARRLPLQGASWDRAREKQTLALWAARHRAHFDAVVVGQTATGILGDEPVYDEPTIFAEDVRAMDALGFTDVAVYALEGIFFGPEGAPKAGLMLRPDVEQWIGAAFGEA